MGAIIRVVSDTDSAAAFLPEDLRSPTDAEQEDVVTTPSAPMMTTGPQHLLWGDETFCGLPRSAIVVMPWRFSPHSRNFCTACYHRLGGDTDGLELTVTAHSESPEAVELLADRDLVGDFSVTFSDELAHEHQYLVAASVGFIQSFSGVERAVQEDRELIYGWGETVDLEDLRDALGPWWRERTG